MVLLWLLVEGKGTHVARIRNAPQPTYIIGLLSHTLPFDRYGVTAGQGHERWYRFCPQSNPNECEREVDMRPLPPPLRTPNEVKTDKRWRNCRWLRKMWANSMVRERETRKFRVMRYVGPSRGRWRHCRKCIECVCRQSALHLLLSVTLSLSLESWKGENTCRQMFSKYEGSARMTQSYIVGVMKGE